MSSNTNLSPPSHGRTHPVHLRPSLPHLSDQQADHMSRQEIGYVGAAYRQDRDLNARLDSAYKASDLHYQRTGRRLYVSKELLASGQDMPELSKLESDPNRRLRSHRSGPPS